MFGRKREINELRIQIIDLKIGVLEYKNQVIRYKNHSEYCLEKVMEQTVEAKYHNAKVKWKNEELTAIKHKVEYTGGKPYWYYFLINQENDVIYENMNESLLDITTSPITYHKTKVKDFNIEVSK